jgi:hypothetical protein
MALPRARPINENVRLVKMSELVVSDQRRFVKKLCVVLRKGVPSKMMSPSTVILSTKTSPRYVSPSMMMVGSLRGESTGSPSNGPPGQDGSCGGGYGMGVNGMFVHGGGLMLVTN